MYAPGRPHVRPALEAKEAKAAVRRPGPQGKSFQRVDRRIQEGGKEEARLRSPERVLHATASLRGSPPHACNPSHPP